MLGFWIGFIMGAVSVAVVGIIVGGTLAVSRSLGERRGGRASR